MAIVVSLTGVGAGVIAAPLLIAVLHVPIEIAVGTALTYSAIVKVMVVPVQIFRGQINYSVLLYMLLGGIPGVILGSWLSIHAGSIVSRPAQSFVLGAIVLVASGWHILRDSRPTGIPRPTKSRSKLIAAIMFPVGAEVGFSSSGAGALGTIALLGLTNLAASQIVGTDLAFGLAVALVGSGVHIISGQYARGLLTDLAFGGVVGAIIGSWIAPKLPNRYLRLALSIWLTAIGIQLCYKALSQ